MELTRRAAAWCSGGSFIDVSEDRIFVREGPGGTSAVGPSLLFLHGYPTSSYDYLRLFDLLPGRRLLTFDFLGFGLSDKPPDRVYSLFRQADLVETIASRCFGDEPFILVAHDMATSVATELLARAVEGRGRLALSAVLLLNGSMVLDQASLTVSQKILRGPLGPTFARLSFPALFRAQLARIFSADHPLTRDEADDAWSLLAHKQGNRILDRLTYYLHERVRHRDRWLSALRDWPGRLELAWAMRDPVCTARVLDAVRALRPHVPLTRFPTLGHYPQLEDPSAVAGVVRMLADSVGAARR